MKEKKKGKKIYKTCLFLQIWTQNKNMEEKLSYKYLQEKLSY